VRRYPVMYNDFVHIGPKSDPAGTKDIVAALKAIKEKKIAFISRGDRSGTGDTGSGGRERHPGGSRYHRHLALEVP